MQVAAVLTVSADLRAIHDWATWVAGGRLLYTRQEHVDRVRLGGA